MIVGWSTANRPLFGSDSSGGLRLTGEIFLRRKRFHRYAQTTWSRTDADIVALDRANEGFSHSVALWTFERRRPRFEPNVAGEAAGVAGDVAAAVIRKPFDRNGQAIDLAEPVLDGNHHQVAHVLAGDAAGSSQEGSWLPDHSSRAQDRRVCRAEVDQDRRPLA